MRRSRFAIGLFLFPVVIFAQITPDQFWLSGVNDFPGLPGSGNVIIRFQDGQVDATPTDLHMNFESTVAVIADTLGNILFYTNGCHVANALGDTMPNGAGLNPGKMHDWSCPTSGYAAPLGAMALPLPGSSIIYYLFHMGVGYEGGRLMYGPFYYSVVDMSLDGGKGAVISKNNIVANGSFEPFAAVRHGNGRDWWIVFPEYGSNKYHRLLLAASGLKDIGIQQIGQELSCRYVGSSVFSPNGIRYARQQSCGVAVLDFDRCAGAFSNDYFLALPPNSFGGGGVAFDKNGNKVLVSTQLSIQAADLTAANPSLDTIVGWPDIVGSSLHLMQYAPDGKILLSNLGKGKFYHLINSPDDQEINFIPKGFSLPVYTVRTLPNFPNFRLYDLSDSPCDTLGIDVATHTPSFSCFGGIRLSPNPARDIIDIELPECRSDHLSIVDATGRWVQDITISNGNEKISVDASALLPGLYFLRVRSETGAVAVRSFIVLR